MPGIGKTTLCEAIVKVRPPHTTVHVSKDAVWRATERDGTMSGGYNDRKRVMVAFTAACVSACRELLACGRDGLLLVDANLPHGVGAIVTQIHEAVPDCTIEAIPISFETEASLCGFFAPLGRPPRHSLLPASAAWELLTIVAMAAQRSHANLGGGERCVKDTIASFGKVWVSGIVEYAARPRWRLGLWRGRVLGGTTALEASAMEFLESMMGECDAVAKLILAWQRDRVGDLEEMLLGMHIPERPSAILSATELVAMLGVE